MKKIIIYTILFAAMAANHAMAQTLRSESIEKSSKAWEVGIGGTIFQFNRTSFSNFTQLETGYAFDLKMEQVVFGGNLYLAKELSNHFYLDLQGSIGTTRNKQDVKNKTEWLYMVGPGLQWRLGSYFNSNHIDPYLRAGVSYMHKDFDIIYAGTEGLSPDEMKWFLNNMERNIDKKDLTPISLGIGLNMWLNDKWGIGMQGDYLLMPYKNVANSLQGTLRVMYRIGGKSKKAQPVIEYVDRIVEVEKIVEKPIIAQISDPIVTEIEKLLVLDNIHFEFDKAELKSESLEILDKLANVLKKDTTKRFLITGYTDAVGGNVYNMKLSRERAKTVRMALIDRGVPSDLLKARGVGRKISYALPTDTDNIRNGDRKVTIELVSNMAFWDYLPEDSF
ncbi:MAG: OmpA family protein [Dysgonomonas sp.]